jgi:hypothetical protein
LTNIQLSTSNNILFDQCVSEIEDAYDQLGHQLGWRFLSVGKDVLAAPVKIALITLNPGGDVNPPDHPNLSCESGVSYLVESWDGAQPGQSKLQIQVKGLFRMLAEVTAFHGTYQQLMEESLIAHFVPFRSPRLADLPRRRESLEFGHRLWRQLLPVSSPKLIICLGRDVQTELRKIIPIATGSRLETTASYPTGWGTYTAEIDEFKKQSKTIRLLYLPHLSTWTLFTSQKCANHMPAIIRAACAEL